MDYIDYIQTMPPSHPPLTRTSAPPFITIPNTTDAEWHTLIERLHNAVIDVSTHFFNITFQFIRTRVFYNFNHQLENVQSKLLKGTNNLKVKYS